MEQIDPSRILPASCSSSAEAVKPRQPADQKTAEAARRILRFDDRVKHTQIYGRMAENGNYKVITKENTIPLVDEEEEETGLTKYDLIDLESELNELIEKVDKGLPVDSKELAILPRAKTFFLRLEHLFDGRESLPFSLTKTKPRAPERSLRENSAGVMTGTFGFSTITSQDEEGSWQTDPKLLKTLDNLHEQALVSFSQKMKMPTKKALVKKMMKLREIDRKVTFTIEELCAFYLCICKAKERMMTPDIKARIEAVQSVEEKQKLIERYHSLNWIPFDESAQTFDKKFLKDKLKDFLEVEFDKESLEAAYSSVTERDIKEYIAKKYFL